MGAAAMALTHPQRMLKHHLYSLLREEILAYGFPQVMYRTHVPRALQQLACLSRRHVASPWAICANWARTRGLGRLTWP